MQTIVGSSQ